MGSVELYTLFSALCTPELSGFDTNIYLTNLPYLANPEKCYSSLKSVKQQRGRDKRYISSSEGPSYHL